MKHFIVHDATGTILRFGICQDEMLAAQAVAPGESALEGEIEFSQLSSARVDIATQTILTGP